MITDFYRFSKIKIPPLLISRDLLQNLQLHKPEPALERICRERWKKQDVLSVLSRSFISLIDYRITVNCPLLSNLIMEEGKAFSFLC